MSILRPKDGDYIVRGIFLLFCWLCIGGLSLTILGGIVAGAGGAAVALLGAILISPVLYRFYLKLDPRVYPQRVKFCVCGHENNAHLDQAMVCVYSPTGIYAVLGVINKEEFCWCPRYKQESIFRTKRKVNKHAS